MKERLQVVVIVLCLMLLGGKIPITDRVIEIGYTYAVIDAVSAMAWKCEYYEKKKKTERCRGAEEVVRFLDGELQDIRARIELYEKECW